MVGAEVTELIHGMAITRGLEGTEDLIADLDRALG